VWENKQIWLRTLSWLSSMYFSWWPSSSNPSQIAHSSSSPGRPLAFIHYTPEPQGQVPTTSNTRISSHSGRSHTSRSGLQRGAAPTQPPTRRSGQHSGTSHVSTDPLVGSTLVGGHTSGSGSGWSGATQVSDTENKNKRRRMSRLRSAVLHFKWFLCSLGATRRLTIMPASCVSCCNL
jgi:hypothetical protein